MKIWFYLACCILVVGTIYSAEVKQTPILIAVSPDNQDETSATEDEPKRLVCYLNFETTGKAIERGTVTIIQDKSGYDNNGIISQGGEILKTPEGSTSFTCDQYARLFSNQIIFNGNLFQAKPRKAITIAAWVNLEEHMGQHSVFDTIGKSHPMGQYHFEVDSGILRWFHRNECQQTVFETMAHEVPKGKWVHIAGTYDSRSKQAKAFIDGNIRNMSIGDGELSRDWDVRAGIGNHGCDACHRPLKGSIDEFRIYNYALKIDEIKALVGACRNDDNTQGRSPIATTEHLHRKVDEKRSKIKKMDPIEEKPGKKSEVLKRSCGMHQKRSIYLNF